MPLTSVIPLTQVMVSLPANLSDKMKENLMEIFVTGFHVKGVNMINQSILALYSYNTCSGIIVDIGERLEIVPVTDGSFTLYLCYLVPSSRVRLLVTAMIIFLQVSRSLAEPHSSASVQFVCLPPPLISFMLITQILQNFIFRAQRGITHTE